MNSIIKEEEDKIIWNFIEKWFPNYYSSDIIAESSDLSAYLDDDWESDYIKKLNLKGTKEEKRQRASILLLDINHRILKESLLSYLNKQKVEDDCKQSETLKRFKDLKIDDIVYTVSIYGLLLPSRVWYLSYEKETLTIHTDRNQFKVDFNNEVTGSKINYFFTEYAEAKIKQASILMDIYKKKQAELERFFDEEIKPMGLNEK